VSLDALRLPTDYRRPSLVSRSDKASAIGNLTNPFLELQDFADQAIGFTVANNPIPQLYDSNGSRLVVGGSIPGHEILATIAAMNLNEPITNALTIPVGTTVVTGNLSKVADVGNAFRVATTGPEAQRASTSLLWDSTTRVSLTSALSGLASTMVNVPAKATPVVLGTATVVDALIAAIYSGVVSRGSAVVEPVKPALPAHAGATKRLRDGAGLTASEIADVFGVRRETVQRWLAGGPINRHHATALNFADVLLREVARRIGQDQLGDWLRMPSMAAGKLQTPLDLLRSGRFDDVHKLVVSLPGASEGVGETVVALHRPEYSDDE
jgi:hypothetical protein